MNVDKIKVGATIPVVQYGNLQPEIELSNVEVKEGLDFAMKYIGQLWNQYSEKGNLTPKEISLWKGHLYGCRSVFVEIYSFIKHNHSHRPHLFGPPPVHPTNP